MQVQMMMLSVTKPHQLCCSHLGPTHLFCLEAEMQSIPILTNHSLRVALKCYANLRSRCIQ